MGATTSKDEISYSVFLLALPFYERWTLGMLRQVEPAFALALEKQMERFVGAHRNSSDVVYATEGELLCRGYAAAIRILENVNTDNVVELRGSAETIRRAIQRFEG